MSETTAANKSPGKIFYWIERIGNKVPNPFLLFVYLIAVLMVSTALLSWFGVAVKNPASGKMVEVKNLLSVAGIQWILPNIIKNFSGFAPLGSILALMIGAGLAERTGLLQALMNEPTAEMGLLAFRSLYAQLLRSNQEYLREIFLLASLLYIDQFEYEQLMAFALRLEFLLGAIRLEKQQVRQETAANFFRDGDLNLLDVIAQSHHPRQVLEYLQQQQRKCAELYRDEQVAIGKRVQGRYKQAVLNYFRPDAGAGCERLADKPSWVESLIKRDWS